MTKHMFSRFVVRWLVSSLGLFVAAAILGDGNFSIGGNKFSQILLAGFVFSLVNMAVRPLLIFLSLPALILTLGLFMLAVNGVVILLASWIDSAIFVRNFGVAVLVGVILGLVNLLVTHVSKEVK